MIPQEVEDLLAQPNYAIIAVNRPTGGPQVTPVWYVWDGEAFYFSTSTDRAKYTHIVRDPAISLIVNDSDAARYVAAYGQAQIITPGDPDFSDLTHRVIGKYLAPDKMESMLQMALGPNRVVVRLQPEKVIVSGKAIALTA